MADRKHSKDLRRRERLAEKQRRAKVLAAKHEFPRFVFVPREADPGFVELVREAVKTIDFRDEAAFQPWERDVYRRVKQAGSRVAYAEFEAAVAGRKDAHLFKVSYALNLGRIVMGRIPTPTLLQHIPFNDVLFAPRGDQIVVYFRALRRAKGTGGTVDYSRNEPKVVVGGERLTVAFSRHAIERAGLRLSYQWPSYGASGDVFAFFDQCLHFEVCELHGGHPAFTFWENCHPDFWSYGLAEKVMGERFVAGEKYCYRVGYCPAVVEGGFLKAKTLLYPGYASTPEYSAMSRAGLPADRRRAMLGQAKDMTMKRAVDEGNDLARWFQAQGVEQIRPGHVPYADPWEDGI